MAKGDAKHERKRRQKEFEDQVALLIGYDSVSREATQEVVQYIETWWGDGLSGAKNLIRTLAYFKEHGTAGLDELKRKRNETHI